MAIPFIVHWPKGLTPGITDVLLSVPDVLPTAMGLAGLSNDIPADIEGTDFSNLVQNPKNSKVEKPENILLMLGNSRGLYSEKYTLCLQEYKKQWDKRKGKKIAKAFVYDNINDPYQLHKIELKEVPELAKKLLVDLGKQLKKTNDPWYQKRKYDDLMVYPEE